MYSLMEVNLNNINHNVNEIKKRVDKNVTIIPMVKADAYGLGDIGIIKYLKEAFNISIFGVATIEEAIRLRKNKIKDEIIVFGQFIEKEIKDILKYNLTVSLSNIKIAEVLNKKAKNCKVKVHLKIDTGMSRLGFKYDTNNEIFNHITNDLENLQIEGIFTHLSSADTNEKYTLLQLERFDNLVKSINYNFKYIHALNSCGIISYPKYQYNAVRPGIVLYGYLPNNNLKDKIDLKPSVKITAKITSIKNITKGTPVSYSNTFTAKEDMKIATVQMGYADGLSRLLSNNYSVKYMNKKCKIIGKICMDMCMIDISKIDNPKEGDYVTVIDFDNSVDVIAKKLKTINYEVISMFRNRVKKVYRLNKKIYKV